MYEILVATISNSCTGNTYISFYIPRNITSITTLSSRLVFAASFLLDIRAYHYNKYLLQLPIYTFYHRSTACDIDNHLSD